MNTRLTVRQNDWFSKPVNLTLTYNWWQETTNIEIPERHVGMLKNIAFEKATKASSRGFNGGKLEAVFTHNKQKIHYKGTFLLLDQIKLFNTVWQSVTHCIDFHK